MTMLEQIALAMGEELEEVNRRVAAEDALSPRASLTVEQMREREEAQAKARAAELPAPPPIAAGTARTLVAAREAAYARYKSAFRSRKGVSESQATLRVASDLVSAYGAACRGAAGVGLRVRHTPNTFSGGNNNGGNHLVAEEAFASGRIVRRDRDVLCQPKRDFFDLTSPHVDAPSCARCVVLAEGLALRAAEASR